jgi:elongation factor Ts
LKEGGEIMTITASLVSELRKITNCGLMDCKKTLEDTGGDIQQAVELLRKKGLAQAVKKANRITTEGVIKIKKDESDHKAVMFEINCETDFVARGIDFQRFCDQVVDTTLFNLVNDIDSLKNITVTDDKTVEILRKELIAKIGENVTLRRFSLMDTEDFIGSYVHGGRIGALVAVKGGNAELAKDIAMHIAATKPTVISPEEVDQKLIAQEREIYLAQATESGKPQNIIEKMVEGRIKKFVDETSLLGQPFVKDTTISVRQLLESKNAQVAQFVRFELGEGIEKEQTDFAAEVMAQVQGK